MNGFKKLLKVISLKSDIINMVLGILLIISLVFIYLYPLNKLAIFIACTVGGFINMMNGMRIMKDPVKKMTGMTLLMTGLLLIVIGYLITHYFIK